MLEHTDKPVVEIAGEHGYDNSSKFASAFRSVKGVSPEHTVSRIKKTIQREKREIVFGQFPDSIRR